MPQVGERPLQVWSGVLLPTRADGPSPASASKDTTTKIPIRKVGLQVRRRFLDGSPLNEGSTTLNLIAGVYRLGVTTAANATGFCGGPEPIGSAQVDVTMLVLGDPSDLNGDGTTDGTDLALVLGSWGLCPGCPADINGDDIVDGIDLAVVLGGWSG